MSGEAEGQGSHGSHDSHERHEPYAWHEPTSSSSAQEPKQSHAGNSTVNHHLDEQSPDGLDSDELALRRMLHDAVQEMEPRDGSLDHLRRAVPVRRARKRQAAVGMAAAALFLGTAVPAVLHVSNAGGSDANPSIAGQASQAQGARIRARAPTAAPRARSATPPARPVSRARVAPPTPARARSPRAAPPPVAPGPPPSPRRVRPPVRRTSSTPALRASTSPTRPAPSTAPSSSRTPPAPPAPSAARSP